MASLESIHLQDHLDGSPRFATMRPVLGALLIPGRGIKTHKLDSSFGGTGALLSDDMAFGIASRDPTRQLTVMSAHRSGEHRRDEEGREVFSPEHRPKRNLVVSGLTPQELEGAIGGKLMIGLEAEVVVHGRVEAKDGAGGVRCEVIRGGSVRVGDSVYVGDLSKEDTDWRIERDIKDEVWRKRMQAGWAEPPECRFLRPELGPVTRLRR